MLFSIYETSNNSSYALLYVMSLRGLSVQQDATHNDSQTFQCIIHLLPLSFIALIFGIAKMRSMTDSG